MTLPTLIGDMYEVHLVRFIFLTKPVIVLQLQLSITSFAGLGIQLRSKGLGALQFSEKISMLLKFHDFFVKNHNLQASYYDHRFWN